MNQVKNVLASKTIWALITAFAIELADMLEEAPNTGDYVALGFIIIAALGRVYATHTLSVAGGAFTLK